MKKEDFKSQKGAISAFVMMAMVFFLVTIMGIYMVSSKRAQVQTQSVGMVQEQYYIEGEEREKYNKRTDISGEMIPIYTKEQLWAIGSGKAIEIEGKVYSFLDSANYELQNDIVIDVGDFKEVNEKNIIKNHYKIYYYYEGDYYESASEGILIGEHYFKKVDIL